MKNVIYTTTAQGCGGNPNAFYGYDLATKKVGQYLPGSGGMWPRTGPSIGKDGTVYAGTGDGDYYPERQIYGQSIIGVKQNPQTKALELKDWYAPSNAFWLRKRDLDMNVTGPIFDFKGKEYLVQSSKECRLWLLDTSALGGEDHRTPVYRTPLICNEDVNFAATGTWGALASWEDANGTRWVLVPFWGPKHSQFSAPIEYGDVVRGAVAAFKMEDKAGKVVLTPAWLSRDMDQAEPPVVANGVVFAYGSGENTAQADVDSGLGFNSAVEPHREVDARDDLRARRAHRQGALVERRSDHVVQSLQRAVGRQRPGLHRHLRRDVVLLRRRRRGADDERTVARVEGATRMKPGSKRLIGAVVVAIRVRRGDRRAAVNAQGAAARMDDEPAAMRSGPRGCGPTSRLTKDAVQKGELKFLWKMKLDNETRQLNSLTTPVLMDRLISHRGFKALAFVGASAERVYAIDTDLARVYWTTVINYSSITPPANSSWACPGGLIGRVTRPTVVRASGVRRRQRRRTRRRSGSSVGEPGSGAPSLQLVRAGAGPRQRSGARRGGRGAAPAAARGAARPRCAVAG